MHRTGRILGMWIVCAISAGVAGAQTLSAGPRLQMEILGTEFNAGESNSGTIYMYIRNRGKEPIRRVALFERARARIDQKMPHISFLWQALKPPIIQPGNTGVAMFRLKHQTPPQSASFDVHLNDEQPAGTVSIQCWASPVRVASVAFSDDLRRIYVYVANDGTAPWNIRLKSVNGNPFVGAQARISNPIPPHDVGLITALLPGRMRDAQYVSVEVEARCLDELLIVRALSRAQADFPIQAEAGSARALAFMDPSVPLTWTATDPVGRYAGVLTCPAHRYGTPEKGAERYISDRAVIHEINYNALAVMHVCRRDTPESFYAFGPLPDVMRCNIGLHAHRNLAAPPSYAQSPHPFLWLADHAWRAASPNSYHAVVFVGGSHADYGDYILSPQDTRLIAYSALASGAKGIVYRGAIPNRNDGYAWTEFRRLNSELRALRPLLRRGCPTDWAESSSSFIAARSLLCGEDAIVVALLDCRRLSPAEKGELSRTAWPTPTKEDVNIEVHIPPSCGVSSVETLHETWPRDKWSVDNARLKIRFTVTDAGQAVVIRLRPAGAPGLTDDAIETDPPHVGAAEAAATWRGWRAKYGDTEQFQRLARRLDILRGAAAFIRRGQKAKTRLSLDAIAFDALHSGGFQLSATKVPHEAIPSPAYLMNTRRSWMPELITTNLIPTRDWIELQQAYRAEVGSISLALARELDSVGGLAERDETSVWKLAVPMIGGEAVLGEWDEYFNAVGVDKGGARRLMDYCLQTLGRPDLALAVSEWQARRDEVGYDMTELGLYTAARMERQSQPAAAWLILEYVCTQLEPDAQERAHCLVRMADIAHRAGRPDQAFELCWEVKSDFPDTPAGDEALLRLAAGHIERRDFAGALTIMEGVSAGNLPSRHVAELIYMQWLCLLRLHRNEEAVAAAERLLAEHPDQEVAAVVSLWQGTERLAQNRFAEARQSMTFVTEHFPKSPSADAARLILSRLEKKSVSPPKSGAPLPSAAHDTPGEAIQ